MNTIPVFVYGTLKREHGNHRALEGSKFLGEAQTVERYALQVQGLPMVDRNNPVSPIHVLPQLKTASCGLSQGTESGRKGQNHESEGKEPVQ